MPSPGVSILKAPLSGHTAKRSKLRHRDIQERRADNVGEWLFQTEEFRTWHNWDGEGEGGKAVLFCYGGPGVGKTFLRYRELFPDDKTKKGQC